MKCTSFWGHSWLYEDYYSEKKWLGPDEYEVTNGDKRICTSCGLIQEQLAMFWREVAFYDEGYAEDKDAVIAAWRKEHADRDHNNKARQESKEKMINSTTIKTEDLIQKVGNKTEKTQ